jgi:hypothetical protein
MPSPMSWRVTGPAAGAALALTLGLAPAQASALGWQVEQTYGETQLDGGGSRWTFPMSTWTR